ncbi:MAG TPA: VOC family protein [Sphingopyxis sp.]|nr:VOC family protein [Sphingopyxis sp.]
MTKMIFINLPVADLAASTAFYMALGFTKNDQFSDETASSMRWSDQITFQLLTREYFQTFTSKTVGNAHGDCQLLIALSADGREEADRLAELAGAHGGKTDPRAPMDLGFMYNRAFEDPDGYVVELVWMNPDVAMDDAAAPAA